MHIRSSWKISNKECCKKNPVPTSDNGLNKTEKQLKKQSDMSKDDVVRAFKYSFHQKAVKFLNNINQSREESELDSDLNSREDRKLEYVPLPNKIWPSEVEIKIEEEAMNESIYNRNSIKWVEIFQNLRKGILSKEELYSLLHTCLMEWDAPKESSFSQTLTSFKASIFTYNYQDEAKYKIIETIAMSYVLPPLRSLSIKYVPSQDKILKKFLFKSINQLDALYINNQYNSESEFDISYYIEALNDALMHVRNKFVLWGAIIQAEDLWILIKSCSHLKILSLLDCKIQITDMVELYDCDTYDIQFINLGQCCKINRNPLTLDDFSNLFKAISQSKLKQSLQMIDVTNCKVNLGDLNKSKNKYGLRNVALDDFS